MNWTKEAPKETGWYWLKFDPERWPGLVDDADRSMLVRVYTAGDDYWFEDTSDGSRYPCAFEGRLWKGPITPEEKPVDLLLFCPRCGQQHIDEARPNVCETCGNPGPECTCSTFTAWLNPPHKSHRCEACNHVWRPADVPTNGVKDTLTHGQRDASPVPTNAINNDLFRACKKYEEAITALMSEVADVQCGAMTALLIVDARQTGKAATASAKGEAI